MCDLTFVTGTRNRIFLGGTITEIFELTFVSLVRIPAVFVLVICGAEPEVSVSSAFIEVFFNTTFESN